MPQPAIEVILQSAITAADDLQHMYDEEVFLFYFQCLYNHWFISLFQSIQSDPAK